MTWSRTLARYVPSQLDPLCTGIERSKTLQQIGIVKTVRRSGRMHASTKVVRERSIDSDRGAIEDKEVSTCPGREIVLGFLLLGFQTPQD